MAKQVKGDKELWFNTTDKGWYYSWGSSGKRKRFGTGKSIDDEASYKRALKRFHHWRKLQEVKEAYAKILKMRDNVTEYSVTKRIKNNIQTTKASEVTPLDRLFNKETREEIGDGLPMFILDGPDGNYQIDPSGILDTQDQISPQHTLKVNDVPLLFGYISENLDAKSQRDILDVLGPMFKLPVPKSSRDFPVMWVKIKELWPAILKQTLDGLKKMPLDTAAVSAALAQQRLDPETVRSIIAMLSNLQPTAAHTAAVIPATNTAAKPIADYIEEWLEYESGRVKRKKLEPSSLEDKRKKIKKFTEHVSGETLNNNLAGLLTSYRAKLDIWFDEGKISGWYHRDLVKFAGQFITWCHDFEHIGNIPRCMRRFLEKVPVEKRGHPLSLPDIKKLWTAANDRQRAFIALALNTGGKIGDISALKGKQLQGNRLIGHRPKTKKTVNVPFNLKLWPITVKLIEEYRDRRVADDYIFVNTKGGRVGTDSFGQVFKKLATKVKVYQNKKTKSGKPAPAVFSQLRDTSTDVIRKILIESGADSVGLIQVFLQHKDNSTAAYYRSNKPEDLQLDALDKATDAMLKVYGLT